MRPVPKVLDGSLADELARSHEGLSLFWLGQAGFLLRHDERVVLIDPYLSDSLAEKYRGRPFDHRRSMTAPITPEAVPRVDLVLCTHRHGDHMDAGTLPVLAQLHPGCRFVVPTAERPHASAIGLPPDRLIAADVGTTLSPLDGVSITPIPAAHETLKRDEAGRHHFLGYCIEVDGARLYHSGDCVPYDGLVEIVRAQGPTLGLLPVNGRDAFRAAAGVPGNFTLDEAIALCRAAGIADLMPHHWGMFAFNSIDAHLIDALAESNHPTITRPALDHSYRLV
jgi:L-ascorbate metabolism protein UlaG (beta-lactamase superfamily)